MKYVALLRGINVGGKNAIAMADLRAAFESDGHTHVSTYIQSGNVLFRTNAPRKSIEDRLEAMVERRFRIPLVVVVRSHRQIRDTVNKAPDRYGSQPAKFHSDVVFLKAPLTAAKAVRVAELRDGVDRVWPGRGVIYMQRLSARLTQSRLNRIASTAEYKLMTIRSWSTVTKLAALLERE